MTRSLRIVSYAINGRGMGHLVRQLAILRWVQRITALLDVRCEVWVLTSSEADTLARREGICALKMPSKAMVRDAGLEPSRYLAIARTWVLQTVAALQPDLLLVDTFPGGSFGELVAVLELAKHRALVARRVRAGFAASDGYQALLPLYDTVLHPDARGTGPILIREWAELLDRAAARSALGIPEGARAVWVSLGGGGDLAAPSTVPRLIPPLVEAGWHVVVGAGPLYQGTELRGPHITWISRYTPLELLSGVDAAVSAGGYNSFHELMFAGVPAVFLPQPRIADDQERRVQRAVEAGAAKWARSLDEVPALLAELGPEAAGAARALVPHNGARDAALSVLAPVLPEADLALATEVLTPELLGLLRHASEGASPTQATRRVLALVRLLSGGPPSRRAAARATLAELHPEAGGTERRARTERLMALCRDHEVPLAVTERVLDGLHRKFPAADGAALLAAAEALFPAFAPYADWMGAISLLRAIPTQRAYALGAFVDDLLPWLVRHDDLFDAVRDLSRLEGGGERPVAEVLRLLEGSP